jgi:3-dehydroquinate synthase
MPVVRSYGYQVVIENTTFKSVSSFLAKNKYSSYFILCDENTLQYCLPLLITSCPKLGSAEIIEVESGEQAKSLEVSTLIWQTLFDNKADRHSLLINLGGGVVSDLGGFTASVYKRGIDFINIPTSLLAMSDASVGGKTGINFQAIKNGLGSFSQPRGVFVNPAFLKTLPERHIQNGLAEIFKIALISSSPFWKRLRSFSSEKGFEKIISESIRLKNKIVLKDPHDKGIRKILNFGHTVGHALEALCLDTGNDLLHGEAVVIGMIVESHIAFQKKMLSKAVLTEITEALLSRFELSTTGDLLSAPLLDLMLNDKKNLKGTLLFSFPEKIGSCRFDISVTRSQVEKALRHYNSLRQ